MGQFVHEAELRHLLSVCEYALDGEVDVRSRVHCLHGQRLQRMLLLLLLLLFGRRILALRVHLLMLLLLRLRLRCLLLMLMLGRCLGLLQQRWWWWWWRCLCLRRRAVVHAIAAVRLGR